jgi:DNA modification methylase
MKLVNISDVKPNPKNPRIIKDGKFQKLVKSIQEFPDMLNKRPLIVFTDVDDKYVVLGGNMRLKALNELKFKEIPIIVADEWTEEQKNEFLIKDNVGFGEWDWDSLANEWDAEKLDDWGLDLPIDLHVVELEAEEDNYEIPNEIETDIVLGDLFEIGEHRLLCGDSTCSDTVAKLMNGEKADMVFTDPPYNIDFKDDKNRKILNDNLGEGFEEFICDIVNNIVLFVDKGAVYMCFSQRFILDYTKAIKEANIKDYDLIIWYKDTTMRMGKDYRNYYEPIWLLRINGPVFYGEREFEKNVWEINSIHSAGSKDDSGKSWFQGGNKDLTLHPTQKPIQVPTKAINNSSKANDLILDLFLGSGSTMVAAHQLKRKCYGTELDPKYCQVIIDRMKKLDPSLVIKKNGVEI